MKISFLYLLVYFLLNTCYHHNVTIKPAFGPYCGSPATNFNFTLVDKDSSSLVTDTKIPRFYSLEGTVVNFIDYQWKMRPFPSDSSRNYMHASTIWAYENKSFTFYFNDDSGKRNRIDVTIGSLNDPTCPFIYTYTQVLFNNKKVPVGLRMEDKVPYYEFHL